VYRVDSQNSPKAPRAGASAPGIEAVRTYRAMFALLYFLMTSQMTRAEGTQADDRGAGESGRGRRGRRPVMGRSQGRRNLGVDRDRPHECETKKRDQTLRPKATIKIHLDETGYPYGVTSTIAGRSLLGAHLHAAELLR